MDAGDGAGMDASLPELVQELDPHLSGEAPFGRAEYESVFREKLARILLDGMYQFVGLLDKDGRTLEINRTALEGAGVNLDDIRGRPFWEARWWAVSEETTEAQRECVRRARAGEFVRCDMEIYGRASGEETIVVDFSMLPVRNKAGDIVFLLAEGRDITEKKRAEAEIARKNAELQSLLEKVRQLDQLKNDLIANVSHELRTPLTLILGPTEEMLSSGAPLSEQQRRQLSVIRRNAVALLKHVNDLLDLAKRDAQQLAANYNRVNLAALVHASADQFHELAPKKSISYVVKAPKTLMAEVDCEKIERVLLNLLSNAFKFTPAGGRIRCSVERSDNDRAVISVQDSGPGVEPEFREQIFDRFRQVQQGTARDAGGTGLGLAIAKEFVELHQGAIGVSAAAGGGALFQVEIPLHAPKGCYVSPSAPSEASGGLHAEGVLAELAEDEKEIAQAPLALDRPKILVVEDNSEMRRFITGALSDKYQVFSVADGRQGLEKAREIQPDLVVTDLMLPKFGGDRLIDAMRAREELSEIPVLVLSAKDDPALRTRLLEESVQDYLTKPFSAHEFRARVRNLVTMKTARDLLRLELASQSQDMTELTNLLIVNRRALQESERRWRAIYEHSPVGIALAEPDGRIRAANQAFRDLLGYSEDEVLNLAFDRILPVEDRAPTIEWIRKLVAGGARANRVQKRFQRKDGGLVWANTNVSVITQTNDSTPMLVVVAEDITERRRAEVALNKAQDELARVSRITTLGELAASIAHEVNQPLSAIVANGHACMRWLKGVPPNEEEAGDAVQRIIRDANRASDVIVRIRRFISRGELSQELFDLWDLIDDVLAMAQPKAVAVSAAIRVERRIKPCMVIADKLQVQQVILNLVMNALESFSRTGEGPRVISIRMAPNDAHFVRVEIADTGRGIAADIRDKIFDAFHSTKPDGMGMGLAISRSIVEAHGGRIWVSPNWDRGVTFSFTLPNDRSEELG